MAHGTMRKLGRAIFSVFNYLQALINPRKLAYSNTCVFSKQIFRYVFENLRLRGKGVPHWEIRPHHAVSLFYLFFIHCLHLNLINNS